MGSIGLEECFHLVFLDLAYSFFRFFVMSWFFSDFIVMTLFSLLVGLVLLVVIFGFGGVREGV